MTKEVRLGLKTKVAIAIAVGILAADLAGYAAARSLFATSETEAALTEATATATAVSAGLDALVAGALSRATLVAEAAAGADAMGSAADAAFSGSEVEGSVIVDAQGRITRTWGSAAEDASSAGVLAAAAQAAEPGARHAELRGGIVIVVVKAADGAPAVAAEVRRDALATALLHPDAVVLRSPASGIPIAWNSAAGPLLLPDGDGSVLHLGDGRSVLAARAHLASVPAEVVVTVPMERVTATAAAMAAHFFVISSATYVAAGGFALIVLGRALEPLDRITRAARRLGDGVEHLGEAVRTGDELQVLSEALEESARSIAEARRRQAESAAELRLAAEDFQIAVGRLSRAIGSATTVEDVAERLASSVTQVTGGAAEVRVDDRTTASAVPDDGAPSSDGHEQWFDVGAWRGKPVVLRVATREAIAPAALRKIQILAHQAALALVHGEDQTRLREQHTMIVQTEKLAALGSLTAGVAHEVNNPLAYIMANEELTLGDLDAILRSDDLPEHARAVLEQARDGASQNLVGLRHIQRIVGSLRAFSRASRADRSPEDLVPVAEDALLLSRERARKTGVTLTSELAPLPRVVASREEVGQILLNLLLNAIDATGKGGNVHLGVSAEPGWVALRVTDDGPGIPQELEPRLFNPFFTTKKEGVGLGLSISHRIATEHGGTLAFERATPRGTTFTLRLPAAEEPAAGAGGAGGAGA